MYNNNTNYHYKIVKEDSSNKFEYSKEKIEFEYSLLQRNFEIDLFWKRSWFFGALLIILLTGYFQLNQKNDNGEYNDFSDFKIIVSFLCLIITFCQVLMIRGSKYWQERWEYKTTNRESCLGINVTTDKTINNILEKYYTDICILLKSENKFLRSYRFSVSKLTFVVWDVLLIAFIFVWINDIIDLCVRSNEYDIPLSVKLILFHFTVISYISNMFYKKSKISEKFLKTKKSNTEEEKKLQEKSKKELKNIQKKYISGKYK